MKLNRARNPETISLGEAVHRVSNLPTHKLDPACATNLWSLVEIRDNAVHFMNDDAELSRRVHEAGCACLLNFATAVAEWFDHDLSEHRFMILPLSFEGATGGALAMSGRRKRQAANLMAYLDRASEAHQGDTGPYSASIRVETRIVGGRVKDATAIRLGGGVGSPQVQLSEEQIREKWPMDYADLQKRAKARMPGLKFNSVFNAAMRTLRGDQKFMHRRHLDPGNPKSPRKDFFSHAAIDALARALVAPSKN